MDDRVKAFIDVVKLMKAQGATEMSASAEAVATVRKALGTPEGEPLMVEGLEVKTMDLRTEMIRRLTQYAKVRWGVAADDAEISTIVKALPAEELKSTGALVLDQHYDDAGEGDPWDDLDAAEHKAGIELLKEIGVDFVEP